MSQLEQLGNLGLSYNQSMLDRNKTDAEAKLIKFNEHTEANNRNFENGYKKFWIEERKREEEAARKAKKKAKKKAILKAVAVVAANAAAPGSGSAAGSVMDATSGTGNPSGVAGSGEGSLMKSLMGSNTAGNASGSASNDMPGMSFLKSMMPEGEEVMRNVGKGLLDYGKEALKYKMNATKREGMDAILGVERPREDHLYEYLNKEKIAAHNAEVERKEAKEEKAYMRRLEMEDRKERAKEAADEKRYAHQAEMEERRGERADRRAARREASMLSAIVGGKKSEFEKDMKLVGAAENTKSADDMEQTVNKIQGYLTGRNGDDMLARWNTDNTLYAEDSTSGWLSGPSEWVKSAMKKEKNKGAPAEYADFYEKMNELKHKGVDINLVMNEATPRTDKGMESSEKQITPNRQVRAKKFAANLENWKSSLKRNSKNTKLVLKKYGKESFLDDGE